MLHLLLVQPPWRVVARSAVTLRPPALDPLGAREVGDAGEALDGDVVVGEPGFQEAFRVRPGEAVDLHGPQRVEHNVLGFAIDQETPGAEIDIGVPPGHEGMAVVDAALPVASGRDPHRIDALEQVQGWVRRQPAEVEPRHGNVLVRRAALLLMPLDHLEALVLVVVEADRAARPVVPQRRLQALIAEPVALDLQVLQVNDPAGALSLAVQRTADVLTLPTLLDDVLFDAVQVRTRSIVAQGTIHEHIGFHDFQNVLLD
mmetsp:Transcript_118985/g.341877  ORF Transcript_118985/g.341877 Transcript_118985/m.341877 type:complete len:259 (+) Transcript_118985:468-1244(+)